MHDTFNVCTFAIFVCYFLVDRILLLLSDMLNIILNNSSNLAQVVDPLA